jgi:hypothetical protein
MGYNLISACHKCKKQIFHDKGEENKTILPFYYKHRNCAKENNNNVITFMDNNDNDLELIVDKYEIDDLQEI